MVASPGTDFSGADGIPNALLGLQRQIDELGRQTKYPFSAGPNGSFQIYPDPTIVDGSGNPVVDTVLKYQDGGPAFTIRPGSAAYGSKQQMALWDSSGNEIFSTDESAGYGISNPSLSLSMTAYESAGPAIPGTRGAALVVAGGLAYIYNPAWHVAARLRFANGANVATANAWLRISDGLSGATLFESSEQAFSIPANTFTAPTFERICLLGEPQMSARMKAEIWLYSPTGGNLSVQAFPFLSSGTSKAWYDSLPALQ